MDDCFINAERNDPYQGVRQLAPLPNRRSSPWPFLFSSGEEGFFINTNAVAKKSKVSLQEIAEAWL